MKTNTNTKNTNTKNKVEVQAVVFDNDIIKVSFETEEGNYTKNYLILEEQEKVIQLLKLQSLDFIFNSLKKLSDNGLVADRKSLEEELGLA